MFPAFQSIGPHRLNYMVRESRTIIQIITDCLLQVKRLSNEFSATSKIRSKDRFFFRNDFPLQYT